MNILIVTDAWKPQINGVVRTYEHFGSALATAGDRVHFITPADFLTCSLPTYRQIQIAIFPYRKVAQRIQQIGPEAIHIGTEGPLGMAARRYCRRNHLPFTTAYHTQFPEYIRLRAPVPMGLSCRWLRHFHAFSHRVLVLTASHQTKLGERGFTNVVVCGRGVDTSVFYPRKKGFLDLSRPIQAYLGRVSVEKNIRAFLALKTSGSKLVIGDGPDRLRLEREFPDVHFVGYRIGQDLANYLSTADVLVFPSRTDTFGMGITYESNETAGSATSRPGPGGRKGSRLTCPDQAVKEKMESFGSGPLEISLAFCG